VGFTASTGDLHEVHALKSREFAWTIASLLSFFKLNSEEDILYLQSTTVY
jgi:hypothetical protein